MEKKEKIVFIRLSTLHHLCQSLEMYWRDKTRVILSCGFGAAEQWLLRLSDRCLNGLRAANYKGQSIFISRFMDGTVILKETAPISI